MPSSPIADPTQVLDELLASLSAGFDGDIPALRGRARDWMERVAARRVPALPVLRPCQFLLEVSESEASAEAHQLAHAGLWYAVGASPESLTDLTVQARAYTLGLIVRRTHRALGLDTFVSFDALADEDRAHAAALFQQLQQVPLGADEALIRDGRAALERPGAPRGGGLFRRLGRSAEFLISILEGPDTPDADRAVARGALSYLVLEEDAIDDRRGLVGYLDDLFVVEMAVELLEPAREPWIRLMEAVAEVRPNATVRIGGVERSLPLDVLSEAALGSEPFAMADGALRAALVLPTAGTVSLLLAYAAAQAAEGPVVFVTEPRRLRRHAESMWIDGKPFLTRLPAAQADAQELVAWQEAPPRLFIAPDLVIASKLVATLAPTFVLVDPEAASVDPDFPSDVTDHGGPDIATLEPVDDLSEEAAPPRPKRKARTSAPNEAYGAYGADVWRIPLLDAEREIALSRQMKDARAEMAEALATMVDGDGAALAAAADAAQVPRLDRLRETRGLVPLGTALARLGADDAQLAEIASRIAQPARDQGSDPRASLPGYRRFRTAQASLEAAVNALTEANLRLVLHIAKKYPPKSVAFLDLVQEGNMGLMKAARKFDHAIGARFSTYATWWIRQGIERSLSNHSRTIRIPSHMVATLRTVDRVANERAKHLRREPTPDEISDACDLPPETIVQALRIKHELEGGSVSLDLPLDAESGATLRDVLSDPDEQLAFEIVAQREAMTEAGRLLDTLDDTEREVLERRFGLGAHAPHTLEAIGKHIRLTRERVRQIELKALAKLRFRAKRPGGRIA